MPTPSDPNSLKKAYYERATVVRNYESSRFGGTSGGWIRSMEEAAISSLLAQVRLPQEGVALDLPTGTGRMIPLLRNHCKRIIASDISQPMLADAARYGADQYLLGDASAVNLPIGSVDLILASRFLFHFETPQPFFREAARLLRPGGYYLFDAYNWTPRVWIPGSQRWLGGRVFNHSRVVIQASAQSHGFSLVQQQGVFAVTPFIYQFMPLFLVRFIEGAAQATFGSVKTKTYYLLRKDAAAGNPDLKTG
jgi:ubiquinone/menaquinone biosynthesis C-methylase UbiE